MEHNPRYRVIARTLLDQIAHSSAPTVQVQDALESHIKALGIPPEQPGAQVVLRSQRRFAEHRRSDEADEH